MDACHVVWVCSEFSTLKGGIRERGIAAPGDGITRRRHFHGLDIIQKSRASADDSKQLAALRKFSTSVVRMPGFPLASATWQALQDACSAQFNMSVQDLCTGAAELGYTFGAVLLATSREYTGPLQVLSPEEDFLFEFHGRPDRWHAMSIVDFMELAAPMKVSWSNSQLKPASSWFTLSGICADTLLAARAVDGRCMRDVIGSWAGQHHLTLEQATTCLQLWPPLARLSLRGQWQTLLLRHKVRVESGPAANWLAAHGRLSKRPRGGRDEQDDLAAPPAQLQAELDVAISPHTFRHLAHQLKLLGAAAAGNFRAPPDVEEFKVGLEFDIKYLIHLADSYECTNSVVEQHGRFGTQIRYNMTYLLRVFSGSRLLRSKGKCKEVFLASMRASLSPALASDMEKLIANQPIPGPATMSHCEFIVDVTMMLHMRKYHAEVMQGNDLPAIFPKFDSSPQGGYDWMNSQWVLVEGKDVLNFFTARNMAVALDRLICTACAALEAGDPDAEGTADLEQLVSDQMEVIEFMQEYLKIHFCVPVGHVLIVASMFTDFVYLGSCLSVLSSASTPDVHIYKSKKLPYECLRDKCRKLCDF